MRDVYLWRFFLWPLLISAVAPVLLGSRTFPTALALPAVLGFAQGALFWILFVSSEWDPPERGLYLVFAHPVQVAGVLFGIALVGTAISLLHVILASLVLRVANRLYPVQSA